MPRPSAYSPWRRTLLQAVLCAILVGTLGLASAVTRYKLRANQVRLTPPVQFGDMGVPLPEGWTIQAADRQNSRGTAAIRVSEPNSDDGLPPRVLTIVRDHLDVPQPPAEYLLASGLMPPAYAVTLGGVGKVMEVSATPVAGQQGGYLEAGLRGARGPDGQIVLRKDVVATGMLPSRDVVTVRLEGAGRDLDADVALVRQIAAGITLPPAMAPAETPETVALPGGGTVKIPAGFSVLPEQDPHVTERHLIRNAPPARWSRLTLVPCVFFPGVDDPETFRTMLSARGGEWIKASLSGKADLLCADVPLPGGLPYPRRACLRTSPTGNALLVEFEAASDADAAEWDGLLKQVIDSATPPAGPAPVDLLAAGAKEVARLRQLGLPSLLAGVPTDQWWVWAVRGRPVGWDHFAIQPGPATTRGFSETRLELAPGAARAIRYTFETSADFSRHADSTVRRDLVVGGEPADRFKAQTAIAGSRYTIALMPDAATGQAARFTPKVTPELLPGPWLAVILPKLTSQEMILRATHLPGPEAIAATSYINVRVRPATRPATFDLDVSGTGQWVTVSPTTYDLSPTFFARQATADQVKKAFSGDPAMRP